jgi:single-stranded DNA-binding protein
MIDALIAGKLHGAPQQRTSKTGRTFTTAKLRVPSGEDAVFCNVVCFEPDTQAVLLALAAGEAVALAGELRVTTWTDKSGTTRPNLDLVASRSLTQYHLTKRRRTMQPEQDGEQRGGQRPSHAAWEAAAPAGRQPYRRDDYAPDPGELGDGPLPF